MITGVNLGGWLVLERWITPQVFAGTEAQDEITLCEQLDEVSRNERLSRHRQTFIAEADFARIARYGLGLIRIPVPFHVFGDVAPFPSCLTHLDDAFDWAERHGLAVLIDLHTVPESQNGHDGGGLAGVCRWHQHPEHVEYALTVLQRLTARYRQRPALWGIEVINEPISALMWNLIDVPQRYPPADPKRAVGSEPVPTAFIIDFYHAAYERIRSVSEDVRIVFHDAFRIEELLPILTRPSFTRIAVDVHLYLMHHTMAAGPRNLAGYQHHIQTDFAARIRNASSHVDVLVGEWSLGTGSPNVHRLGSTQHRTYYQAIAKAQLAAWEGALGWVFWTYRVDATPPEALAWDLRRAIKAGYLPDLTTSDDEGEVQP